jgi:hypothetical protein
MSPVTQVPASAKAYVALLSISGQCTVRVMATSQEEADRIANTLGFDFVLETCHRATYDVDLVVEEPQFPSELMDEASHVDLEQHDKDEEVDTNRA